MIYILIEYEKCLVEVDEVLNHLSKEELNKIPEDVLKGIKKHKDKEYMWKYDESKRLEEQRFDRNTIVILSYINMEYLLSKEQKDLMEKLHELNEQNFANEIQEKYDSKDLFKNKNKTSLYFKYIFFSKIYIIRKHTKSVGKNHKYVFPCIRT